MVGQGGGGAGTLGPGADPMVGQGGAGRDYRAW